jgi:hypothetical protein
MTGFTDAPHLPKSHAIAYMTEILNAANCRCWRDAEVDAVLRIVTNSALQLEAVVQSCYASI